MDVSVCVTAYNEENYLPGLLSDIRNQNYPHEKMEIVLVDSGSEDKTKEQMEVFQREQSGEFLNIQVIDNPGRIQSCGWNEAMTHFTTGVMIRIDAHSHIPPEFVSENVKNLQQGEMVSGGVRPTLAESETPWSRTLLMAEESMFGSSVSSFRRKGERAYVKSFFHGAYRREVLEKVGGFREDLGRTEDNEFHYRIRRKGYRLSMSPDIISYQYIRPSLRKMWRQKYGNGYWIGLTLGVCPGCLSPYYFVPWAFVGGIFLTTLLLALHFFGCFALSWFPVVSWLTGAMWLLYWLLAVVMSVIAVRGEKEKKSWFQLLLPLLFFSLHVSYGIGTWVGMARMPFWRKGHKNCSSVERVKEQMRHE
jgi:glycosyltransferase involved in cell wall biosynthesis